MSQSSTFTEDHWLRRLAWSLHALPASDRDDILLEARSHIEDRIAQGQQLNDVLHSLGTPEQYAHRFFEEFELFEALGSRTSGSMLRVASQRVHRSAAAAMAMLAVLFLSLFGFGAVLTALMHFIDPAHWGVWSGQKLFLIGGLDQPGDARELLGVAIYPAALLSAFLCWKSARIILLWALRIMAKR